MSTTEEEHRHDLIEALHTTTGHPQTGTLMGHLPPVGWADVAAKQDLAHVESILRLEMGALESRFEARLHEGFRKQTVTMITANTAIVGILVTVSSLLS